MLGEETYDFNEEYFLLTSVDLPLMGQIIEAGPEKPYLAVMLKIDTKQVAGLQKIIIYDCRPTLVNIRQSAGYLRN